MAADLTAERLLADIADALGEPVTDLHPDEDLFDRGLDSVRLMGLIETWRAAGARGADFADLAEQPTAASWARLLRG
ncbi:phosphopantetheine-binding protein [Nocardiopsis flavescens]|uniref:L-ornithine N5-oxygenase n=1 Tax=Nocardiopsis flavescens TaxID=758803 RepID=A0A1M6J6V1_9ACTN|nr:phosphopantetheine-binding protein [Nocardiopsis flavescens]SHJ42426.1 L-ornithine N5-oxygenase [Nocardiopsis flavescens]